jgi:dihydroneopterin aldolase / 2-amino-4-hydroxy-6-hydroxymethyldihydropteridine diphosphokinase
MSVVYIGIGSNLGDRKQNIEKALEKLKSRKDIELVCVSSVIETEPEGCGGQSKFLNACCRIDTTLYPDEVLSALKSIEREMGRDKNSAPRKLSPEEQLKALDEGTYQDHALHHTGPDRRPENKYAPRVIDLDILLYDDIIMKGNNLTIPHSLMHKRFFVLQPLSEIAPEFIHPVLQKPVKNILEEINLNNEDNQQL